MTSRFYFDLTNGLDTLRDDEGVEASGLNEAAEQARAAMEDMRVNEEAPAPEDGWWLIIRDEDGATLKTLPLYDFVSQ